MAELPFSDAQHGQGEEVLPGQAQVPHGTGVRRAVIALCGIVLTLGLAC